MGFGIAAGGNWSGDGRLHAMHFPAHLLIPLTCGFIYVLGALCLKRAADGAGVWRATFVTNLAITGATWRWLAPGALLLAANMAAFAFTLAQWQDATAANIVYSSRGLWSVAIVWAVGHWFANHERHAGRGAMLSRLAGATLMVVAIVLVVAG